MQAHRAVDPFAALMPAALAQMPIAWHHLRIPGPPAELELNTVEQTAPGLTERFARRTIQQLAIVKRDAVDADAVDAPVRAPSRLALIDKASPHALFDLMLCEVSPSVDGRSADTDPGTVGAELAQVLWATGANFHRFVSEPAIRRQFGLGNGVMHLALNCDPLTRDRESVQALKRFHLHLIYWRASELAPLQPSVPRFGDQKASYLTRQCIDPLSFLGTQILNDVLSASDRDRCDATWLDAAASAVCAGRLPLGALARMPSWDRLAAPEFEQLISRLHGRIVQTAQVLKQAFTGTAAPPALWSRHGLLPLPRIAANLEALDLSAASKAGLLALARALRDLKVRSAQRLQVASAAQRKHCMTLNQPCYSLTLSPFAPAGEQLDPDEAAPPLLSVQPKLFSGIGGAGLLSLPGRPSVRVVRAQGRFSHDEWRRRADFQRRFAAFNTRALQETTGGGIALHAGPIRKLQDLGVGWTL